MWTAQTPAGVVGQDAARSVTNDADQFLATQMKLVQSDGVLRPVDERFRLRLREKQSSAESPRGEAAPIVLKKSAGDAPAQHLSDADQLPLRRSATGGGRGQCHRGVVSGTQLRHPHAQLDQPGHLHGAAIG